ncbi:MAG TPA: hypothetical protein VGQ76_22180 [Thermoanaerobaculia bacterium]|jgi:hypothetical protein|nr:hypothetical protein [Thermoanaerobaculia bacterium]
MRSRVFSLSLGIVLSLAPLVHAQKPTVEVAIDEVVDNRVTAGQWSGTLELRVTLKGGSVLEKADAARVLVKDARDDKGNVLSDPSRVADFTPREYNNGTLQVSLGAPARAASTVKVKGTVELFVPTRDPNSIVTIDKALSKLDTPLNAKALKAAKISLTPLSPAGYKAAKESRKLDEAKIAEIRAEGKKRGVSDAEIEMAIEMAKAFEGMDSDLPAYTVILSGTKADFDRVFRVEILGADGKPMSLPSRSTSTRGESSMMTLQPSEPPPPNASLQIYLLTDKSRVTAPFELTVPLP